jgi:O-antigen ligase
MAPRLEIWDFISRRALQSPFIGHGTEATKSITFDTAQLYQPGKTILHPHNFALQLWIEFGAFGAALGAAFLGDILSRIYKFDLPLRRFSLALLMASLSVASTGYGLWQGWWLGVFCLLIAFIPLLHKPLSN